MTAAIKIEMGKKIFLLYGFVLWFQMGCDVFIKSDSHIEECDKKVEMILDTLLNNKLTNLSLVYDRCYQSLCIDTYYLENSYSHIVVVRTDRFVKSISLFQRRYSEPVRLVKEYDGKGKLASVYYMISDHFFLHYYEFNEGQGSIYRFFLPRGNVVISWVHFGKDYIDEIVNIHKPFMLIGDTYFKVKGDTFYYKLGAELNIDMYFPRPQGLCVNHYILLDKYITEWTEIPIDVGLYEPFAIKINLDSVGTFVLSSITKISSAKYNYSDSLGDTLMIIKVIP